MEEVILRRDIEEVIDGLVEVTARELRVIARGARTAPHVGVPDRAKAAVAAGPAYYRGVSGDFVVYTRTVAVTTPGRGYWDQEVKLLGMYDALENPENRNLIDAVREALRGDVSVNCNCLAGDTKVPLLDGRVLTLEELLAEYGTQGHFWVYSTDEKGDFIPGKARNLGVTTWVTKLVDVELDSGSRVRCTSDHPFRMRNGRYKLARELSPGDSLMPLYLRVDEKGYKVVKSNSSPVTRRGSEHWDKVFWIVASIANHYQLKSMWKRLKGRGESRIACHHINENKGDDRPENLLWMGYKEHWLHHASLGVKRLHEGLTRVLVDPVRGKQWREHCRQNGLRVAREHPEVFEKGRQWIRNNRELFSAIVKQCWTTEKREAKSREMVGFWSAPERRAKQAAAFSSVVRRSWSDPGQRAGRIDRIRRDRSTPEYRETQRRAQRKVWSDPELLCKHSRVMRQSWEGNVERGKTVSERNKRNWEDPTYRERCSLSMKVTWKRRKESSLHNHAIKSVQIVELDAPVPVYDLSVEGTQNFLVDAGVVVHNCPAFLYWGYEYILTRMGATEPGETRPPIVRNPREEGALCKHLYSVLVSLGFFAGDITRDLRRDRDQLSSEAQAALESFEERIGRG